MKFTNDRCQLFAIIRAACCGVFLCAAILATGPTNADDWPTYQHDSAHTGRSAATFDPTLLTKKWGLTNSAMMTPVVAGNSLYNVKGSALTSYNVFTGQQNWSTPLSGGVVSNTLTYAEGMIVSVGPAFGGIAKLFVWDATTGLQKYTVDVPQLEFVPLTPTIARNS